MKETIKGEGGARRCKKGSSYNRVPGQTDKNDRYTPNFGR